MIHKRINPDFDAELYDCELDTTTYTAPVIWGNIVNDSKKRFPTGKRIHTSEILGLTSDGYLITENSIYRLIRTKPGFDKLLDSIKNITKQKEIEMSHIVKIFSTTGAQLVENKDNAGYDLQATEAYLIEPGQRALVKTGIYTEFSDNLQIEIRPRSGLALKNGITVLNTPGTIDSSYRGEIGVILFNTGIEPFQVNIGDRIAQAVFMPVIHPEISYVKSKEDLGQTDRGEGGYGSTGK
jgi:dUTP pyrophosphatase